MRKFLAALLVTTAPAAYAQHDHSSMAPPPAAAPAPAAVAAQATGVPTASTEVELAPSGEGEFGKKPGGFHLGVSLDHSISQGTFEDARYYAFVGGSVPVSASYGFSLGNVRMGASAMASFSYEYTTPDNPTGRHWDYSDIGLGLSAPAIWKDSKFTGISISPRIGLTIPISMGSLFRQTITNMSGGVSFGRAFGKVNVGLNLGLSKTLYASLTRRFSENDLSKRDEEANLIYICRTDSFNCGLRGVPTLFAMSGGLNAGWSPIEKLSIGVGFNLSKSVKYYIGNDEYSSRGTTIDGQSVIRDQATSDMMMGSIGVSYQLTDALSASFGMGTGQTPKSLDNKRFRFPWFNFEGPASGTTAYSLTLSGSY